MFSSKEAKARAPDSITSAEKAWRQQVQKKHSARPPDVGG